MAEPVQPQKKTILVVDDTPDNLVLFGELLMPHYQVRVANSGLKALAAAAAEPRPDLILLDVMMPEMDGYQVIARLKTEPETRDIPVMFITALDQIEDEVRGLELGAADYVTKPVKPAILLARVRGQLDLKEARDILRDKNAWPEAEVERRVRQYRKVQDASMRLWPAWPRRAIRRPATIFCGPKATSTSWPAHWPLSPNTPPS